MPNIVCFDKHYTVQHTYESLDALLEEIKGSKTQAEKALNDVTLNFRGYKLIEDDKIPSIFAALIKEREENLRNEYGSNIEDLEKQIKDLTKKERQAKFKVDELEDSYSQKYTEYQQKHTNEKQAMIKEYNANQEKITKDFNDKIESLVKEREETVQKLKSQAYKNESELINIYQNQVAAYETAIKDYQELLAENDTKHKDAVLGLEKDYTAIINSYISNIVNLTNYLEGSRNNLLKQVDRLTELFNQMIANDTKVYVLNENEKVTLDLPKFVFNKEQEKSKLDFKNIPEVDLRDYLPNWVKEITYDKMTIPQKPRDLTVPEQLAVEKVTVTEIKQPEITEVKKDEIVVPETKQNKAKEPETKVVVEEAPVVKNVTLKTPSEYTALTDDVKGMYLSALASKGLTLKDLYPMRKTDEGLSYSVATVFLSEVISNGLTYSACTDYLTNIDAEKVITDLKLSKEEVDKFLEVEPLPTKEEPKATKPNVLNFNWEKYVKVISSNVDMEELLDQDRLLIRDLQRITTVPSKQIINMMGVMKKLGYEKEFPNDRVVSRMESIFLIAVASSHNSQKGKASLEDLITSLYPTWIEYVKKSS